MTIDVRPAYRERVGSENMFERIDKFEGLFIALYACEMGELGEVYLGHYKIFTARPSDYWVPGHVAADIAESFSSSPQEAMDAAKDLAIQTMRRLAKPATKPVPLRLPSIRRVAAPRGLVTTQ